MNTPHLNIPPAKQWRASVTALCKRIPRKLVVAVLLLIVAGVTATCIVTSAAPQRARALLAAHGFTTAEIGGTHFNGATIAIADIKLDTNAFSTVRALRVKPRWTSLFGHGFIGDLIVDDMRLIGEWQSTLPDIAGWTPRMPPYPQQDSILVNGLRADLDTPLGMIRMESKGRATRNPDGSYRTEAVIFGKQHEITIDTRWIGQLNPNNTYSFDGEIMEATLRTETVNASRASGWLQFVNEQPAAPFNPTIAGQLQMGRLVLGDLNFGNVNLTLEGPLETVRLIFTGEIALAPDMRIQADLTRARQSWNINATVTTKNAKDMLEFLQALHRNLEENGGASSISSFMVTKGNVDRLTRALGRLKFDELDLLVEGPINGLHGSLVARTIKKDGTVERTAISLDPGNQR